MPTYDFKCKACGLIFSDLVKYEDKDKVVCTECGFFAEMGWWTGKSPSFKVKGGTPIFSNTNRIDGGVPFGEVAGDSDYEWLEGAGGKNREEFVEKNKANMLGPLP